jgi:hypothetical protein
MKCCPQIVASQDFTGQTGALAATTIYTPTSDGTFLILVANSTQANGPATLGIATLTTTDEYGNAISKSATAAGNSFTLQIQEVLRVGSGQPIQISAALGGSPPVLYDVFVVILQLE